MKKLNKKTALSLGAVIVVLIIVLLLLRKNNNIVYQNGPGGNILLGGVTLPELQMDIPRYDFTVPTFTMPDDQFSMISGCCSDCNSKAAVTTSYLPPNSGNTFVFNSGNKAGDIYNYYEAPVLPPSDPPQLVTWYGSTVRG